MPTGTGKTVCLLSLIVSYIRVKQPNFKLVYCTRTIVEMEKTLSELKFVMDQRAIDFPSEEPILAMSLSSRKNLCIHEKVSALDDREKVDGECRSRTASWIRDSKSREEYSSLKPQKVVDIEDLGLCGYYEEFMEKQETFKMPHGIYTLDDLREFGKKSGMCPYFLARRYLLQANVIVYSYQYMLDPKISNLVSKELQRDCVVVFDECHNIDNACIESFSLNLNRRTLEQASTNIKRLDDIVKLES